MTCVSLEDIISQSQEGRCCLAVLIGGACCHPVHRVYKGGCQGLGGWATRSWYLICCRSVAQLCLALCSPMDCSTPGFPVLHHLLELAQTHVHWVSDAIQPFHPLSSPSSLTFNLSQHHSLFQWVSSSKQVAKVLELQLLHQSFQWIFRVDSL